MNIRFQNVADLVECQLDSRIINEVMKHSRFCAPCPGNKNAIFTLAILAVRQIPRIGAENAANTRAKQNLMRRCRHRSSQIVCRSCGRMTGYMETIQVSVKPAIRKSGIRLVRDGIRG